MSNNNSNNNEIDFKSMSYVKGKLFYFLTDMFSEKLNRNAGMTESWSAKDGKVYKNIKYGSYKRNVYDLYLSNKIQKDKPTKLILFVHGGTWSFGCKNVMSWACRKYAKHGYITAALSYNLLDRGNRNLSRASGSKHNATVYDMIEDIDLCINSVVTRLSKFGYSVSGISLSGESAGSHLSMLYAYSKSETPVPVKMIFTLTSPVSFQKGAFTLQSDAERAKYVSMLTGVNVTADEIENNNTQITKLLATISPTDHISYNSCPTLMGFASKDSLIGPGHYGFIKPVLDKYNIPNDVFWFENSDHPLDNDPGRLDDWIALTLKWLEKYM